MSKKLYEETNIQAVASAIREKNGTQNQYTVAQMASAVRAIQTQPTLQEKTFVDNGSYTPDEGYDGFSEVTVSVPSGGGSAVIQPLNVTQNGVYNPPSGVDGYGPVTVNVDSSSPVPIYPDEKCIDRWDFTSETPLIGTLNSKAITHRNTTFDSNGAHFADGSYIIIPNLIAGEERLIRIVLGECTSINPSRNHRFVMASQVNGFLWNEQGSWAFYNGQFEMDHSHTNLLMFSNSELIIHIDTDGTWAVYKNSELVYSPTQKIVAPSEMYIGSSDQSINGFTIEKLEIYRDIDSSDIVPSETEIEVIPLSVGSNGVYAAPSGKAYSPVSVNVSGGNSGISAGTADPTASYGSDGDIYIKYGDFGSTTIEHTYAAKVTKFKRGTSDLNYVSAAEIDLIFDDGNNGEVSIRDISDFSYGEINGSGERAANPSPAFDNNVNTFAEYNPTPVTWLMSATIPPAYTPKTLRVVQRDYNNGSDVWSSFTLSDTIPDLGVSVEILSEENLQTTDWAGVRQWTDFACNGTKAGGKVPLKYFVKENGSWNEITKDAAIFGIIEILT